MVGILLTCALSLPVSLDSISEYFQCRNDQHMIEYVSEWTPLIAKYFDNIDDQIKAHKIIYCESKGDPVAVGLNRDGSYDVGLWQFNDNTWAWLSPKLKITSDRTNPEVSTAVASWLIKNDGWFHWNSSKHCWENNEKRKT